MSGAVKHKTVITNGARGLFLSLMRGWVQASRADSIQLKIYSEFEHLILIYFRFFFHVNKEKYLVSSKFYNFFHSNY